MPFTSLNTLNKAVFIDRDGVVNELVDRGDNFFVAGKLIRWTAPWRLEELRVYSDAKAAIALMKEKGYLTILVTNQPDIATGNMKSQDFALITRAIKALSLDAVYACLHHPKRGCFCHKPAPGLLYAAGVAYSVDPQLSYMIGDRETDVEAGKAAGVRTIRVTESDDVVTAADHRVRGIMEAALLLP